MTDQTMSRASAGPEEPVEVIVDNPQAAFTGQGWQTSTYQPHYYGSNYAFVDRAATSTTPRTARWTPTLPGPGQYTVSVWLPDGNGDRSDAVTYRVRHAGTESQSVLDQTGSGGYWRQLGRGPLAFDGSGSEYVEVRLADVPGRPDDAATYVQIDALRFATPPALLTAAPGHVAVTAGRNYVELGWDALEGASSYVVSRALRGRRPREIAEVTDGTGYLDLSLDTRQDYVFTVAGVNGAGVGPASALVKARYAPGPPLQAVQGLTVSNEHGRAVLSWQPATDATSYRIERSARSGRAGRVVATTAATGFTDRPRGDEAHYVVRAVNRHGAGALASWQRAWLR